MHWSKENEGEAGDRSVYTINTLAPKHFGTTKCDHSQSFLNLRRFQDTLKATRSNLQKLVQGWEAKCRRRLHKVERLRAIDFHIQSITR